VAPSVASLAAPVAGRLAKSAPAQKALPSAASTTARHSGSRSKASNASPICAISALSKKLLGGRRISTVPTRSDRLTPISLYVVFALMASSRCLT
jgi:hypothetical protein